MNLSRNTCAQQEPQGIQIVYLQLGFSTNCLSGIFYTDTTPLHPYEPVGCFKDKGHRRAFPELVNTYPAMINDNDLANSLAAIIRMCATEVYKGGFWYFGVEHRFECWSGVNGDMTYNRNGHSDECLFNHSVGTAWTIFVYRFVEG